MMANIILAGIYLLIFCAPQDDSVFHLQENWNNLYRFNTSDSVYETIDTYLILKII